MPSVFSHIKRYTRWYVLSVLIFISITLWVVVLSYGKDNTLTFATLNIGQGDALFIESPTGIQVVIDGGPNRAIMKELSAVMPWYDRHIDMLVVTNPDRDHFEGFIPLLDKYKVDVVLVSGTEKESEVYKVFENKLKEKKIPEKVARRGQVVDLGGGSFLQILFPDRDTSKLSPNDGSIVMKLVYGKTSVMLQGDSTSKIEEYLVTLDKGELKSDILKTGHHGSRTSTSQVYVEAVEPGWAIISAGEDNSYGHPHQEVVDNLNKHKVKIIGTYDIGRIVFESDGENFVQK